MNHRHLLSQCCAVFALLFAANMHAQTAAVTPASTPGEFAPVDLFPFVTTIFSNAPQGNTWSYLPRGRVVLQGIPFKIDGKFEITGMDGLKGGNENISTRISGIPIGRKAEKLVLLHATGYTEKDGAPLADLVLHYAGGKEQSIRIVYGVHVRNWYEDRYEKKRPLLDPNTAIVWSGGEDDDRNTPIRLHRTILANPLPSEVIQSVDIVSLFSHSPAIIFALTTQNGGAGLKPVISAAAERVMRKGEQEPDAAYIRTMKIRAVTAEAAEVLTNAALFVTLADDSASYSWGAYKVNAQGEAHFDYPPQHTLFLNLLVKSPGRAPLFLSPARETDGHFPSSINAKLERGTTIGGVILDETGKPVPNAEVLVSSVSRTKARTYTQLDYDQVRTDASGKWSSRSMPQTFSNLTLQLKHPEFRATVYQQPGTNSVTNIVATPDLLAQNAMLTMRHGLVVQGTIKDNTGKALANADVYFIENLNSAKPRRSSRTGADGKYSFVANADSGEGAVAVIAKGFAPRYEAFFLENNMKPLDLALGSGGQIKVRLMDQQQMPVAGATVKLEGWYNLQLFPWQTLTDTNGQAVWTNAPDGPVMLSFNKTNYFNMRSSVTASGGEMGFMLRKMSMAAGTVIDAETKQPIDDFTIIKGHSYSPGEPIRWNRYSGNVIKGRNGRYSIRLEDYYNGQTKVMIESPGYMPVVSQAFTKAGWYTNNFELKKGRGATGFVVLTNGEPVPNCSVVLVDAGNSAYLDQTGEFRSSSSSYDFVRTDIRGHFQFPPKAETQTLMAAHDKGFVQLPADKIPADGKIVLQPWGHIKGVAKVGPKPDPGRPIVLQSSYGRYEEEGRQNPSLSLYIRGTADAQGHFEFHKVPPGTRSVGLLYEIKTSNRSSSSSSHTVPALVKAGQTNEVTIGGTGRTITGRMTVAGGDPTDVDWKRDFSTLNLRLPGNPELEAVTMPPMQNEEQRQQFWQERNERMKVFWMSEKGRELQLKQRSYTLNFETNGTFQIYNVPPGTYDLYVNLTESEDEDNGSYRQIGSLSKQVTVSDGPADQPFDIGAHEMRIRRQLRIGQTAPAFEGKSLDGKAVKLQDFKGKHVLIDFSAKWSGSYAGQIQTLKTLNTTYGKDGRLVILTLSVDYQEQTARELATEMGITWPVCYLGGWSETAVPGAFGVDGIPHAILIGPDGKIVAKNLQGTYLRTAVRNAIERRTATTMR